MYVCTYVPPALQLYCAELICSRKNINHDVYMYFQMYDPQPWSLTWGAYGLKILYSFIPCVCTRSISHCFVCLSVCPHKNSLNWSFRQLRDFYLVLIYWIRQKKTDLPWLRIEQHWPRELQMVVFVTFVLLTPIKNHTYSWSRALCSCAQVLLCHSYKHKRLHDVCSLCTDQQTRRVCAL